MYTGRRALNATVPVVAFRLDPFVSCRGALRSRLGLRVDHVQAPLSRLGALLGRGDADAVLFVPSWRHSPEEFREQLASLPSPPDRPPLALFDTFDQTSSPYFDALPFVDLYVKSQLLRDRSAYRVPFAGGFILSDWVNRTLGVELNGWSFGVPMTEPDDPKLLCGWNMGGARLYRYIERLSRLFAPSWGDRPIQISRRFSVPVPGGHARWEWYQEYRRFSGLRIAELGRDFRLSGNTPLSYRDYVRELGSSQLAFSPFGWGEVCFRDFEAVAAGAVLVKPDMSHLETHPNIYEDRETYLAVRWDLADLADVCRWALDHPDEARRIAANARRRVRDYLRGGFEADVGRILNGLLPGRAGHETMKTGMEMRSRPR